MVGRRCKDVSPAEAAAFVAGYTCGNDVTARDLQKVDGQWTRAKSFDTFCPLGPWIVPEAPSAEARVSALLDGVEVQHGFVGDMIVAPLELLAFVSGIMTLEPGDVLMTGTPPGVGPLAAGQTVTIVVEGVGELQPDTRSAVTPAPGHPRHRRRPGHGRLRGLPRHRPEAVPGEHAHDAAPRLALRPASRPSCRSSAGSPA